MMRDKLSPTYNVKDSDYILITAARNEADYIDATIKSVLSQTILPKKWIIVSDGSTDNTDNIIKEHSAHSDLIDFVRREKGDSKQFDIASKVFALNTGYERLRNYTYDYIGHLDADITMERDYYNKIIDKLDENNRLGVAGGFIYEPVNGYFECRPYNTSRSVAGAIQLFRRKCYEDIGGFIPLKMGGEDTYAEIMARMRGWEVQSFPEIIVHHHKIGNLIRGKIRESFRKGMASYSLGSHPLFEVVKSIRRMAEKPYLVSFFIRMLGFIWPYFLRQNRLVSEEFIRFMRKEQLALIGNFIMRKGSQT